MGLQYVRSVDVRLRGTVGSPTYFRVPDRTDGTPPGGTRPGKLDHSCRFSELGEYFSFPARYVDPTWTAYAAKLRVSLDCAALQQHAPDTRPEDV